MYTSDVYFYYRNIEIPIDGSEKKIRHALFNMFLFTSFNLTVIVFPHFPCFNTENKYLYQSGNFKWVTKASESTIITKMTKIIRFISH